MRKVALLLILAVPGLYAQAGTRCEKVGGSILTNFYDSSDTIGSATGDLSGGLGVHVIGIVANPDGTQVLHVQHHLVTDRGDTINIQDAYVTVFPASTSLPGFYAASYLNGVNIQGGTGRFAGAKGNVLGWGAVDLGKGELILRYEGTVCFARDDED